MAVTSATIEAAAEALVAAIDAGDLDLAERKALALQTYLAILPDYGIGGRNLRYGREAVTRLIENVQLLRRTQGAGRGGAKTLADTRENAE